jgi:hypothetical protein
MKKVTESVLAAGAAILERKKFGNSLSCAARRGGSGAVFGFAISQTVAELKMKNAFTGPLPGSDKKNRTRANKFRKNILEELRILENCAHRKQDMMKKWESY